MDRHPNSEIKSNQIVYSALLIGPLLFLIITIILNQQSGAFITGDEQFLNTMLAISIVFSFAAISAGVFIFKSRMKALQQNNDILEEIIQYREAMIVRAALFEAAAFFAIVGLLLFGHYIFIVIALACLVILALHFPTKQRIAEELNLNKETLESL